MPKLFALLALLASLAAQAAPLGLPADSPVLWVPDPASLEVLDGKRYAPAGVATTICSDEAATMCWQATPRLRLSLDRLADDIAGGRASHADILQRAKKTGRMSLVRDADGRTVLRQVED
jgi:hypothetical protein